MESQRLTESLRETLAVFDDAGEPLTTSEVAERLDLGRRSTYDRLDRLVDRERLRTKKVGASARVWWRVPAGRGDGADDPDWPAAAESLVADVLGRAEVGVVVVDAAGDVAWVNNATERYFGVDRGAVVGRKRAAVVDERIAPVLADADAFADRVQSLYDEDAGTARFECRVTAGEARADRWLEHRSKPVESGAYAGGRVELYFDVTERKRTERAYRTQRDQFESLVDAVEEYAIFRLDADGRVQTWNAGAERLKGYDADEILGEHVSTFYTDPDREAGVAEENLEAAAECGSIETEGWREHADGTRFWANVTITAIRDDDGDLTGFAKVIRDMTEHREYEDELQRERDLLKRVFEAVSVGVAVLEGDEVVRMNEEARQLFGSDGERGDELFGERTVRDADGDPVAQSALPHRQALETNWPVRDWVGQLTGPDGDRRWLSVTAVPVTTADGGVDQVIVSAEDVTQHKEQARQLQRTRDDLERELDSVLDRIDDGFYALDDNWRFTYVNERAADLLDEDPDELVGANVWDRFPAAVESAFQGQFEHARETGESVSFEAYFAPLSAWFEVSAYPSESGLSVYFRDVTERKERERERERYETIVETVDEGIYVVDDEGYFTAVNETYAEMVGYDRSELLGAHVSTVVDDEETLAAAERLDVELAEGDRTTATLETTLTTSDGDAWIGEATFSLMETESGYERVGAVRNVTERIERERELERYERIVETVDDGIYAIDGENRFVTVNDAFCDMLGYDRAELLGMHATDIYDEEYAPVIESRAAAVAEGERAVGTIEFELVRADGSRVPVETRYRPFSYGADDADGSGRCGVVRDITDRIERERELQRRIRQQEVVTDLGQRALEERDLDALMRTAAEMVAATLDNDYCKVLDLDADAERLLLRQGVGWSEGMVGSASVSAVENDSQAAYTLQSAERVVVEDLTTETRFYGPALLRDHDVRSGISVVIGPDDDPWGILGTHDTEAREFTDHDVNFVQSVATILATAINRHDHEQALVQQREQLEALNSLNRVVRETTDAVLEQSTREEIERTVCEHLADSDSYAFAWIGEVDGATGTVALRTEAGVEGYLDDVTISVDPDDEHSGGPTGRAIRTGEVQSTQRARSDPSYEPWHDAAATYDFESSAAIPISYEGTTYGVLNVYAGRPHAFRGQERAVLGQLGEVVGHAIAATERKRALLSDEVVELEFQVTDIFEAVGAEGSAAGRFSIDHIVRTGDDEFLVYGTASADGVALVERLVEALPHWTAASFTESDDEATFELRMDEPPVLSALSSLGGSVERAVVEDGDYHMTLQVSPTADVRKVIDAVTEEYPEATMLRRQQVTKDAARERGTGALLSALTERQRTALEAAYHAGFFEWPRDASGEDVAESLQVSPPTFHQHLRKAENKVFGGLFESAD